MSRLMACSEPPSRKPCTEVRTQVVTSCALQTPLLSPLFVRAETQHMPSHDAWIRFASGLKGVSLKLLQFHNAVELCFEMVLTRETYFAGSLRMRSRSTTWARGTSPTVLTSSWRTCSDQESVASRGTRRTSSCAPALSWRASAT